MNSKKILSILSIFLCLLCSSFYLFNVDKSQSYCFSGDEFINNSLMQQFNQKQIITDETYQENILFENEDDSYDENATDLETLKRINWLDVWD